MCGPVEVSRRAGGGDQCDDGVAWDAVLRTALPAGGVQQNLLLVLQVIGERLARASIPYWVTGGTLLGAIRHGGFIPHDDDLDLELYERDLPRAIAALRANGRSFRGGGEWMDSGVAMGRIFWWGVDARFTVSVDVFLRGQPAAELAEFPSEAEIHPLASAPFHGISVPVPACAESFLRRCYGPTWCEEVVVWNHSGRHRTNARAPVGQYTSALWLQGMCHLAPRLPQRRLSRQRIWAAVVS